MMKEILLLNVVEETQRRIVAEEQCREAMDQLADLSLEAMNTANEMVTDERKRSYRLKKEKKKELQERNSELELKIQALQMELEHEKQKLNSSRRGLNAPKSGARSVPC
jgi:hypothetical protein